MKKVQIYTTTHCPFCHNAVKLLKSKGIDFEEINIADNEDTIIAELSKLSGIHTVPQIFVNKKFIGGCDDLYKLERQNMLDKILN